MRVDSSPGPAFFSSTSPSNRGATPQPARVIPAARAALDAPAARALLGRAWEAALGSPAPAQGLALLTAQWALETDRGRSMPGHNFGGIKSAPAAPGASFRTVEGYADTRREVTARFRVYASAESGAEDYVRLLARRYPAAIAAASEGDTSGFAHALAAGGYFTADPRAYARGLEQRLLELANPADPKPAVTPLAAGESAIWGLLRSLCRDRDEA